MKRVIMAAVALLAACGQAPSGEDRPAASTSASAPARSGDRDNCPPGSETMAQAASMTGALQGGGVEGGEGVFLVRDSYWRRLGDAEEERLAVSLDCYLAGRNGQVSSAIIFRTSMTGPDLRRFDAVQLLRARRVVHRLD